MPQPWTTVDSATGRFSSSAASVEQRFWAFVDKTDTCWLWTGHRKEGYGRFAPAPRVKVQAHRFAYEVLVGPIPDGLELDHLCRVHACVNPGHLEPVTHTENVRRAAVTGPQLTHCLRGHEFTESNTHSTIDRRGRLKRTCRQCSLDRLHARRARQRAERPATGALVPCRRGCGQEFAALGRAAHEAHCSDRCRSQGEARRP